MKYLTFFLIVTILAACDPASMKKPDNLIEEEKMENILYELYVLEAIRQSNPASYNERGLSPKFIYKKYKVDSLQFARSDRFYASDIGNYGKMYEKVMKKIESEKVKTGTSTEQVIQKKEQIIKKGPLGFKKKN